jgi:hypothetical protein
MNGWRAGVVVLVLALFGCGDCDTGNLDVTIGSRRGGTWSERAPATVMRGEVVTLVFNGVAEVFDLDDVPAELLPDGSTLYFEINNDEANGQFNVEISVFNLENGGKGSLRGLMWGTTRAPKFDAASISVKQKDCGSCGDVIDTVTEAKLPDGKKLSADSGYRTQSGNVELGNGHSFFHERHCGEKPRELHHGYLFVKD